MNKTPKTRRHNTIIEHTASRIALNNQLEVFLKVKQAGNNDFSFLNPSDELHGYYLCLKEKCGNNKKEEKEHDITKNDGHSSDNESVNPLLGLLGDYGSSSSDESTSPTKDEFAGKGGNLLQGKIDDEGSQNQGKDDKKRKAKRMERLRLWKERQLNQGGKHSP